VEAQKETAPKKPLYGMFTDIPPRYDLINHLITWGMDGGWRRKAARECLSGRPLKVLDLCCGTGDLALTIAGRAGYRIEIQGLDYSQPMLDIAARKAARLKDQSITFACGDASRLPFPEAYFDRIGISFAFRNLTYRNPLARAYLSEIIRVLKPGGRCVIAESSQPRLKPIRGLYHFYMRQYVYRLGAWLSGNKAAYRYLAESTSRYYSPPEVKELLTAAGFKEVSYRPLLFGAAGIYVAEK
jgi:demethylmenaquinone methyltransferase/2-methoxy-6-polyprenyl-1,4-benzoquinol methylase